MNIPRGRHDEINDSYLNEFCDLDREILLLKIQGSWRKWWSPTVIFWGCKVVKKVQKSDRADVPCQIEG